MDKGTFCAGFSDALAAVVHKSLLTTAILLLLLLLLHELIGVV